MNQLRIGGNFFLNSKSKEHTLVVGQFKLSEQSKKKTKVNKPIELNQRKQQLFILAQTCMLR